MKTIKVFVTQEDIDRGTQQAPDLCPVQLAVVRARPVVQRYYWRVGALRLALRGTDRTVKELEMPDSLRLWVHSFDKDRKSVAPFSFKIDSNGIHV